MLPPSQTDREITVSDIISIPDRHQWMVIERATRLFGNSIMLHSYHSGAEERLDAWFRHSDGQQDDYGLDTQEAVSQFRHKIRPNGEKVFGPWAQAINLSNPYLAVTIVHELGHLVDRYHLSPRTAWTSASEQFHELYEAYSQTQSWWIATNALRGRFFRAQGPNGESVGIPNDSRIRQEASERALEMLKGHEVFARSLTAFVFYEKLDEDLGESDKNLCRQFLARVASARNRVSGYDLSKEDYEIMRDPMRQLLNNLRWRNE